jgi:hypothetical protein
MSAAINRHRPVLALACALLLGAGVQQGVRAADYHADVSAGFMTSDNLLRLPQPVQSNIEEVRGSFAIDQTTRALRFAADGGLIYRKYGLAGLSNDVLPSLRATANWAAIEETLALTADANLGELARNSTGGLVPTDRERFTVLTVGPDLRLPIGGDYAFYADARYSQLDYAKSPFDSHKAGFEAGLERSLGADSTWRLLASHSKTDFLDSPGDFTLDGLTAKLDARGRRTDLSVSLGLQRLDDGADTKSGWMADINAQRRIGRSSTLTFDAASRYASAAELLARRQDLEADVYTTVDGIAATGAVREDSVSLGWLADARRSSLALNVHWFNNAFRANPGVANRSGLSLSSVATFRATPRLMFELRLEASRESPELEATLNTYSGTAAASWFFTRDLSVVLGTDQYVRMRTTDPRISEGRWFLRLNWKYYERRGSDPQLLRLPNGFRRLD